MNRYRWSSVVCLSVYLSVCWSRSWTLQKRLNRSRCRLVAESRGSNKPCIRRGSRSPTGSGNFWGSCGPFKSTGSLCYGLRCKKNNSIRRQVRSRLLSGRCHIKFSLPWKKIRLCDAAFRLNFLTMFIILFQQCWICSDWTTILSYNICRHVRDTAVPPTVDISGERVKSRKVLLEKN